jgi:hypothetical protein
MVGSTPTRRNIQEPKKGDSAMNRHQRRRRAVMDKHNRFVRDYVHHLPEAGPDVLGKPGVSHMVCYHDEWCQTYDGNGSNCEPVIRFFAEPKRA